MALSRKAKVVVMGGGTGTHTVLRGLRHFASTVQATAIVSMADSGGSTGRLRDEFGYLPIGDVRNALTALAAEGDAHDVLLRRLFEYRFTKGEGLSGHNFGNLFLTALTDMLGSEAAAITAASQILRVTGAVIPVTIDNVQLRAVYDDGVVMVGESKIDEPTACRYERRITQLSVTPVAVIHDAAARSLREADVIVLGPGDLYTSVLANCVVDGVAAALSDSPATFVYVANLMTKRGQTTGYSVGDHVAEITRYVGRAPDIVVAHAGDYPADLRERYAEVGEFPVALDDLRSVAQLVQKPLLAEEHITLPSGDHVRRSLIRHDPIRLAKALLTTVGITNVHL